MPASLDLALHPGSTPDRYALRCGDAAYDIEWRPETDIALGELLGRLPAVRAGGGGPARQSLPLELLYAVGVRLWRAVLPETVGAGDREALCQALLRRDRPLRLSLPPALAGLPWELLCDPVIALHDAGHSQNQIAAALATGRHTIRRFLRAERFPQRSAPEAASKHSRPLRYVLR